MHDGGYSIKLNGKNRGNGLTLSYFKLNYLLAIVHYVLIIFCLVRQLKAPLKVKNLKWLVKHGTNGCSYLDYVTWSTIQIASHRYCKAASRSNCLVFCAESLRSCRSCLLGYSDFTWDLNFNLIWRRGSTPCSRRSLNQANCCDKLNRVTQQHLELMFSLKSVT